MSKLWVKLDYIVAYSIIEGAIPALKKLLSYLEKFKENLDQAVREGPK